VAIIGASDDPETINGRLMGMLSSYGYQGAVYPVNPGRRTVQGTPAYPSVRQVPVPVDVALVAVRAERVPEVLRDCAEVGVGSAVILSSGFGEGSGQGADLAEEIRELMTKTAMRVVGPNCEGLVSMSNAMPLTFSPAVDPNRGGRRITAGSVAVISQSGGLAFAVAQWGTDIGIGFSSVVTTGNEVDLDVLELAEQVVEDPATRILALVYEELSSPLRLTRLVGRAGELGKRVVGVSLGRSEAGARAARAHTLHRTAGEESGHAASLHPDGILLADDGQQLVDVVQALAKTSPLRGRRVGVVTTSGGAGVWLADACQAAGFDVPALSDRTRSVLGEQLPGFGSPANPVDLTAQFLFSGGRFASVLVPLLESGEVDAVVLVTSLGSPGRMERNRDDLAALTRVARLPLLVYSYTLPAPSQVEVLNDLGLPWYVTTRGVANALEALAWAGEQAGEGG
jgi:acyl-CoA synthetase (NDP forming)